LRPVEVRRLAADLDLRPSKALGQNFVIDPNTVRRIVRTSGIGADDVVVEVGPGLGSLTLGLLDRAAAVIAIEVDDRLAGGLAATVSERRPDRADRLTVITADALSLTGLAGSAPTALVANLPYNVAVPVLLHLLERLPSLCRGLVMVQAEVADRLVAPPGSRVYGAPSAKLAWYADARRAGAVARTVFWPAPRVDSGLVAFRRHDPPGPDRTAVFALVDAAFGQRRKTLRAALAGWAGSPVRAERILRAAGIDPGRRGESLGIEAFVRLAAVSDDPP